MVSRPGEDSGDREGQGAMAASGSQTPSCSPVPAQLQPELERSYLSFPGHTEASKGHCAVGPWLPESAVLSTPVLGTWEVRVPSPTLSSHLELGHRPLFMCQENRSGWSPGACFQNLALLNKAKHSEIILTYY